MVERLTVFDRAELATDVGPNPRHITVLLVLGGHAPDVAEVRRRLERAVTSQPRLTARVHRPDHPFQVPTWEVGSVDLTRHVVHRTLPGADPVAAAVEDLMRPLPADRPAWRLTVLDLGDDARSALVWTCHHVLGNGPSLLGLLLDALSDTPIGTAALSLGRRPGPAQTGAAHAFTGRDSRAGRAGRSPLLRAVTGGVTAVSVTVDRAAVRAGARTCGATVNDALLWAWARAFGRADLARGGPGERVVVSVPATVPRSRFGNHVGTLRIAVPSNESDDAEALAVLAARTRRAKSRIRPWTWPLAPFGACVAARLGLLPVVLRRQRLLSTVVTHATGPSAPVQVVGAPLLWTVPLVPLVGNVTTCAVAVSLGGRLDVAVVCSPESADLADALAQDLQAGLDEIAALAAGTRTQLPPSAPSWSVAEPRTARPPSMPSTAMSHGAISL
ncbi:wax ester/triacylglycerol synthase domain-containing protein [Cellulomonas sp. Leaf395]|uniref:wax ester/triacylglycerol synthase domain-containing protein n=1 Tax=Cellulomonas sp. Leaf395 TaxID=1736362 RepID=UPI0006F26F62|nr:wax ester/triacylglycerol synthase domain-containing protein [Cellulomonas sp. Leaf395]KQS96949.1 hypothetical protein ASG23_15170 [Cellulomonas sp. Leaf395]